MRQPLVAMLNQVQVRANVDSVELLTGSVRYRSVGISNNSRI